MAIDKNSISKEAQKFVAKGQYEKAIAEWNKLLKATPDDPNIYNTIGDLCLKKNAKADAVEAYHKAADLLAADGFTSKAIALYKKVLNIDIDQISVHLALGDMNVEKGLIGNALENYKHVADHYIHNQETAKALAIYQKMADLNTSNVAFQVKLGDMYAKEGMKDKSARAYLAAADVHLSKSAFKDARQLFEKVLALDPGNKEVYHKAGIVYFKEEKFLEACKALKPAFESDPSNKELSDIYLEALEKTGKDVEAEQAIRTILDQDSDNAELREKLYRLYLARKDYDKAIVEAATLADEKTQNEDTDAAEKIYTEFVAGSPDFTPGHQKLAEFYISINRLQDAAAELMHVAELLTKEGDLQNARNVLTQAIDIAPNPSGARELLEQLQPPVVVETPQPEEVATAEEEHEPTTPTPVAAEPEPMPVPETPAPAPPVAAASVQPEEDPAIAEAFIEADVLNKYGLAAKAIERFEALTSKFPENPRIHAKLRDLFHEQGNIDKTVEHSLLAADLYTRYGKDDQATAVLETTLELAHDHPVILSRLGRALVAPEPEVVMSKTPEEALPSEIIADHIETPLPEPEMSQLAPEEVAREILAFREPAPSDAIGIDRLGSEPPSAEEPGPAEIIPEAESPAMERQPVEEEPAITESTSIEQQSVEEETTTAEPTAIEQQPAEETALIAEEPPVAEEGPVAEEPFIAEETPASEEQPVAEEPLIAEEPFASEEQPVAEEPLIAEETFASEGQPVAEEPLIAEETPASEELPVAEELFVAEEPPASEELLFAEEPSASEELPAAEVTAEERPSVEEELVGAMELSASAPSDDQAAPGPLAEIDPDEIWAEAEFYFQQGLFDEARKNYAQILALTPRHQRAIDRLAEISREENETREFAKLTDAVEGLEGYIPPQATEGALAASASDDEAVRSLMQEIQQLKQQATPLSPPEEDTIPAPPAEAPPDDIGKPFESAEKAEEDVFFDLGKELQLETESSAVQLGGTTSLGAAETAPEEFFDLAAELRDELSTLPVPVRSEMPSEEQSLDDIFEEFKKGIEQHSTKEDADTHYNLGVAYKEMGLLDDAIGEFILNPVDEPKFIQSRYMLGLCYMEKGEYQKAIDEIQNALAYSETMEIEAENRIAMHYDLGLAFQGAGNINMAISEFQEVVNMSPKYRDTAAKLKELRKGDFISLEQLKDDIEKEISSKFLEEGVRIEREEKTKKNERVRN